jgi:hypothetical protein
LSWRCSSVKTIRAIALAVDLRQGPAQKGRAVRLRVDDRIAQREAPAWRDFHDVMTEREDFHFVANLARENRQTAGRFRSRHLGLGGERREHRSRRVDQKARAAGKPRVTLDRLQHRGFELGLEIRRVTRRRDEVIGKDTIRTLRRDRVSDGLARHLHL